MWYGYGLYKVIQRRDKGEPINIEMKKNNKSSEMKFCGIFIQIFRFLGMHTVVDIAGQ